MYKKSGNTKFENANRCYVTISSWRISDNVEKDIFNKYCRFKNDDGTKDCNVAYALESTYEKLEKYVDMNRYENMINLVDAMTISTVEYKNVSKLSARKQGSYVEYNPIFVKDKKYSWEKELRIAIYPIGGIATYNTKLASYQYKNKKSVEPIFLPIGGVEDFLIKIHVFNKITQKISTEDIVEKLALY